MKIYLTGRRLLSLLLILTLCYSCKDNKKRTTVERIVSEWIGKQVNFPANYQCCVLGKDTISDICAELFDRDYKILLYIDSAGCTSCRLHIEEWTAVMQEMDDYAERVSFLIFFYSKRKIDLQYIC
jgi:hypothetical protein